VREDDTARTDRMVVVRADASAVSLPLYRYGAVPNHDLVHYAVEVTFGLRWGFFGLVIAGASFEVVQRAGARRPGQLVPTTDPLVAEHLDELLLAEQLVAGLDDLDDPDSEVARALSAAGHERCTDPALVAQARELLADRHAAWQAVPVGGRLRLPWPLAGGDPGGD